MKADLGITIEYVPVVTDDVAKRIITKPALQPGLRERPEHLALELTGLTTTVTNPEIYALGTVTTAVSRAVILVSLLMIRGLRRRQARRAPDTGGMAP